MAIAIGLVGETELAPCKGAGLEVLVHDDASLSPHDLKDFVFRLRWILIGAAAFVEIRICQRAAQPSCQQLSPEMRSVQVRILRERKVLTNGVRRSALGYSVAGRQGGRYGVILLDAIKQQAGVADVPPMMLAAYAAAHEIGHLILGADAHGPNGLMKGNWDRTDMEAMFENRVHFSRDQEARIAQCCGSLMSKNAQNR